MVQASSALGFGAFGLSVTAERVEAGEAVVEVESPGGRAVFCAGCGGRARSKGRRLVVLRDAPLAGGMPVRVLWNKRIWACPDQGCGQKSWTEQSGLVGPRRVLTESDPFHIVRLANGALDDCRRRTQNETTGHRGRKGDPLYGARKLLLMGAERLDERGRQRLRQHLDAGDPYDEVADCWAAKEKIRSVFKTPDPDQAARRLDEAIEYCRAPEAAPELHRLARTLHRWRQEINTSTATGTHNGRTEAANAKIKDVKRSGRGFANLANYRLRILLAAGQEPGQTQPVTKIRTRRPSFVA